MEKLTHGLFNGRALFLREEFDDYEFVVHSSKKLYTVVTTRDFEIKEVREVIADKSLNSLFDNPSYLRVSSFSKGNRDDQIYFGYLVSKDNPDTYVSFQIQNGYFKITNEVPNAQAEIEKSNKNYLFKLSNIANWNEDVINNLTDIKYIVKHSFVYITGQIQRGHGTSLVFIQYNHEEDNILVEKEYFSEKYKITAVNMFLNRDKECLIYGYKKEINADGDSDDLLFLDCHFPFV
jgi:hypothetical protein